MAKSRELGDDRRRAQRSHQGLSGWHRRPSHSSKTTNVVKWCKLTPKRCFSGSLSAVRGALSVLNDSRNGVCVAPREMLPAAVILKKSRLFMKLCYTSLSVVHRLLKNKPSKLSRRALWSPRPSKRVRCRRPKTHGQLDSRQNAKYARDLVGMEL
jgi:hypothetical protein